MRSNGLATILLLVPVLTVPALAIFGIPQFAPVVASPLDEGRDRVREARIGNSARNSHDEIFGDVEGFGSEPTDVDDFPAKRREPNPEIGFHRRVGAKNASDNSAPAWGEEVVDESDWPTKAKRRAPADEFADTNPAAAARTPKKTLLSEKLSRSRARSSNQPQFDDSIRLAGVGDVDRSVMTAGFSEEVGFDSGKSPAPSRNPTRREDVRPSQRREPPAESLTWQNAVQRLNELEIRNFRLEPGHQVGQFMFICSYTPPNTPQVSYRFEAEADEPLKAVEKVLEQIAERQQRR